MSSIHLHKNPVVATNTSTTTTTPTTTVLPSTPLSSDIRTGKGGDFNHSYPFPSTTYEQVVQNADVFMETLKDLHGSLGTKFMVPTLGGKALDLHCLFVEVTSRGGLEKVIRNRQWKEIIAVFNFPATITNASFVLRKYYISLLHHYEQVYFFRSKAQPTTMTPIANSPVTASPAALQIQSAIPPTPENGTGANELPANSQMWPGRWVTGTIDGKFDSGYLVTVSFGSEKLKGVLYHVPLEVPLSHNTNTSVLPRRRNRKRSRLAALDPTRPKPNRSGYNFFFSEHYANLKSSDGQEKTISTKIGNLWSNLTEAEKQVYREKGLKDKERYKREMIEYRKSSNGSKPQ